VGTDDAGRRQYLYHERFRAQQDQAKHAHLREVARALPALRERVAEGLAGRGLSRTRVTACAVRLLTSSSSGSAATGTPPGWRPTA
jgi:DNA topoisomerase IB